MTSRQLPPPANSAAIHHQRRSHLLFLAAAFPSAIFLLLLLLFVYLYFSHSRSSTLRSSPLASHLYRFSYRELHAATSGFAATRSLGRGATANVFHGILADGKSVAVKRVELPPSSPELRSGDREFCNELKVLDYLPHSDFVVSLLGYCFEGNHQCLIVYEYMTNGSLQEVLFGLRRAHVDWSTRFQIILDIAKALTFLHQRDPPIIHGDIKPSNVLLGHDFRAKISDFGLSQLKTEAGDISISIRQSSSSSSPYSSSSCLKHENNVRAMGMESAVSPCDNELGCAEINDFDRSSSLDDGSDWRWEKDEKKEPCSREYMRDWIGSQINPAKNLALDEVHKSAVEFRKLRFEEGSLDETLFIRDSVFGANGCNKTERKSREWWKEEYFEEISKKGKGNKELKRFKTFNNYHRDDSSSCNGYNNHKSDGESNTNIGFRNGWMLMKKTKKKRKKRSRPVSNEVSSEDPLFSQELSRTRSMRGTVCYIAPEYSGCGIMTEKADIYNFGVLILVIISGRRPLHVLESPMKLDRANLISWCRKLAQTGNVLDIVDENLKDSYNKDQVSLCINVALLCLQRMPDLRPDSWDIVRILEGEKETTSTSIIG